MKLIQKEFKIVLTSTRDCIFRRKKIERILSTPHTKMREETNTQETNDKRVRKWVNVKWKT